MSPPSVDDADFSRWLRESNRTAQNPFPHDAGLAEAYRRGYIDEKGNPK